MSTIIHARGVAASLRRLAPCVLALAVVGASTAAVAADGDLDANFGVNGARNVAFDLGGENSDEPTDLAIGVDDSIWVVGRARTDNSSITGQVATAHLSPRGAPDAGYGNNGRRALPNTPVGDGYDGGQSIVPIAGGGALITSTDATEATAANAGRLTEVSAAGDIVSDVALVEPGTARSYVDGVVLDASGRPVIAANFGNPRNLGAYRYDPALHVLDPFFGDASGRARFNTGVETNNAYVARAVDGKLFVAGNSDNANAEIIIGRLTAAGTLDTTFAPQAAIPGVRRFDLLPGEATASILLQGVQVDSQSRIVVGGILRRQNPLRFNHVLVRFTAQGTPDPAFDDDGVFVGNFTSVLAGQPVPSSRTSRSTRSIAS